MALCTFATGHAGVSQDDLLEPEKAFRISTRPIDERNVEVRFQIADGYYMYRDRFKFETEAGELLGDVELPRGKKTTDAFFGETEIYRREALIRVPLTADDTKRGHVNLRVTSQGCADIGVCYTPLEQIVQVRLPGASSSGIAVTTHVRAWLAQDWLQALLGAAALAMLALSLQFAPPLRPWRARAHATRWFYPGVGFAFLGLLIWSAYPVLVQPLRHLAWGAWLVMGAMWLRAIDPLPHGAGGAVRVAKGVGVIMLAAGVILLAFAAGWRGTTSSPATSAGSAAVKAPQFERIANLQELEARVHNALRPTMLDFYADWCVTCKEMERFTFSDAAVAERMLKMQLLQADVTRNTSADKALMKRFGIFGPPAILFFDQAGSEMRSLRVIGYQSAEPFRTVLDNVLLGADKAAGGYR